MFWTSRDPLGFEAGDSNLYRYVNNRPTVGTDPSGREWIEVNAINIKYFYKPNQKIDIVSNGSKLGTLKVQMNPKANVYRGLLNLAYDATGGIAMSVHASKGRKITDFHFFSTFYTVVNLRRPNKKFKGIPSWRPEKVVSPELGDVRNVVSSLWPGSKGTNYYVDADKTRKDLEYPTVARLARGDRLFFDHPTATIRLVKDGFLSGKGTAYAVSAQIYFATYVYYKKTIVARVTWLTSSSQTTTDDNGKGLKVGGFFGPFAWIEKNMTGDTLRVGGATLMSDFQSNPLSSDEIKSIKRDYPTYKYLNLK